MWRIKTKQEFQKENLWNSEKETPLGWNSSGKMNYLLGSKIPDDLIKDCELNYAIKIDNWKLKNNAYINADLVFSESYPVIPKPDNTIFFDINRLSEEIDGLFEKRYEDLKEKHINLTESFNTTVDEKYNAYLKLVSQIAPDFKEMLLNEIRKSKTTIILNNNFELSINELDHPILCDVIKSLNLYKKVMLVGPAGTGKTYMVDDIAKKMNLPFYKYSCSRDSSVHDLLGYKQPSSEVYLETVFLKAYENGGVFLVDKIFVQTY